MKGKKLKPREGIVTLCPYCKKVKFLLRTKYICVHPANIDKRKWDSPCTTEDYKTCPLRKVEA